MNATDATRRCDGSGQRPLEMVILDVVPGMNPSGTCPVCERSMTLADWYVLPEHERREA